MKSKLYALIPLVAFATGYYMVNKYSMSRSDRNPASTQRTSDFTGVQNENLNVALKMRIGTGLQIRSDERSSYVGLANFKYLDDQGFKRNACDDYNKILIKFVAEGETSGAGTPEMELDGTCVVADDDSRINPLWLPVSKILGEKPADGVYNYAGDIPTSIKFTNIQSRWPTKWILKEVAFVRPNGTIGVIVGQDELNKILNRPVMISFKF